MGNKYCFECGSLLNENDAICPTCGTVVDRSKLPAGYKEEEKKNIGFAASQPNIDSQFQPHIINPIERRNMPMGKMTPPDDSLVMLAEYCTKTMATVGGDGYTEWVLNRNAENKLQIDYYRNYQGYENEVHTCTAAADDTFAKIMDVVKKYHLKTPPENRNHGMCGGCKLVKVIDGKKVIRLVAGGLNDIENEAFSQIRQIILDACKSE